MPMRFKNFLIAALLMAGAVTHADQPNIIFILADDLGYGDLGCYNSESRIPTPNLDRLAAEGMRFTNAHTPSSVCTPTRYGILTGRYCWRTWLKKSVLDGFDPPLIEPDRLTVAKLLKQTGYTTACIGKWHLGMNWTQNTGHRMGVRDQRGGFRPGYHVDYSLPTKGGPNDVGFDYFFGISASLDMSPYCFIENRRTVGIPEIRTPRTRSLVMNQVAGVKTKDFKLNDVLPKTTAKAIDWINRQAESGKRFFAYLPLNAPHLPVVPNQQFIGMSRAGAYGDFVHEVDHQVGEILQALRRNKIEDNTLVIFTSDNGSCWGYWDFVEADDKKLGNFGQRQHAIRPYNHQANRPWRGQKADTWEGGHRVPFIVRWPAQVKSGTTQHALVELTDLIATCAEITGTKIHPGSAEDSNSILPLLSGKSTTSRTFAVHHALSGMFAIREGDWKLIIERGSGGFSQPRQIVAKAGEPAGQLYNLETDPQETTNVYLKYPDMVRELTARLTAIQNAAPDRKN
jgi:arylsulfatase A